MAEYDPVTELAQRFHRTGTGCLTCHSDAIFPLLQGKRPVIETLGLREVWNNATECAFCEIIGDIVRRACDVAELEEYLKNHECICRLYYRPTKADLYQGQSTIAQLPRIQIKLRLYSTSYLESLRTFGDPAIDLLSPESAFRPTTAQFRVRRVRLKDHFDTPQLRAWLTDCDSNHKHETDFNRSSHNVQIQGLVASNRFRLINVETGQIEPGCMGLRYCALSYVWGRSTAEFVAAMQSCGSSVFRPHPASKYLDMDTLPQTIKDAMSVVRHIGERHLWCDALCIDQSDATDREANIAAMSSIYGSSILTIIAGDGADASTGIHRLHSGPSRAERQVSVISQGHMISFLDRRPTLQESLDDRIRCPWNSRAWTYQEYLLSRRCLIFFIDEVFFSCGSATKREAYELVVNPFQDAKCSGKQDTEEKIPNCRP